jgi:hypothetical protein
MKKNSRSGIGERPVGEKPVERQSVEIGKVAMAKPFYTFGEIASDLNVSHDTVRRNLRDEPGVVPLGKPGSKRPTYRVPAAVYERFKLRLAKPPKSPRLPKLRV